MVDNIQLMKYILLVPVFSLLASFAYAQPANLDFENWYSDTSGNLRLFNWDYLLANSNNPSTGVFGTWRDTIAEQGLYALTVSRWYNYTDDWARQKAAMTVRPASLSGYYSYIDDSLVFGSAAHDTALVQVFLTKWNSASVTNDTIGYGRAELTANATYTAFSCTVFYLNSNIPDSITINIFPTKSYPIGPKGMCVSGNKCSYLTVDNLSLESVNAIVPLPTQLFQYYPNPVANTLFIKPLENWLHTATIHAVLTNIWGQVVWDKVVAQRAQEIDMQDVLPGNYFITFKDDTQIIHAGRITKM